MFKQLIAFSLIILGLFSIFNFISHHSIDVADGKQHAMIGIMMILAGILVLRAKFKLGSWSKFDS